MAPTTSKAFENKMPQHSSLVPGSRLKLGTFNGDILKYLTFKRKFIRIIEMSIWTLILDLLFLRKRVSEGRSR